MKVNKTYTSKDSYKLVVTCDLPNVHQIVFGGADRYLGVKGTFKTKEPEIQSFLENSPLFNKEYELTYSEAVKEEVVVDKKTEEEKVVTDRIKLIPMSFKSINAFKTYMDSFHHVKAYTCNSQQKCKDLALEYGIEVIFEK